MDFSITHHGTSRSFPAGDSFLAGAKADGPIVLHLGGGCAPDESKQAVLVELDTESLAVHAGEHGPEAHSNVVGFARYRNGDEAPSPLIELVRQRGTRANALDAARGLFESAGFVVVVCADQPGRILDRLVRPKYNNALRLQDEGLASQADIDLTCRLGLGYPDGPIERVVRGGLLRHYEITTRLFETFGMPAYAPARQAVVARQRGGR